MADSPPPPISLKQLRKRLAKQRRWTVWAMGQMASIEGQAGHRVDELLTLETRIDELIHAQAAARKAPPLESTPPTETSGPDEARSPAET